MKKFLAHLTGGRPMKQTDEEGFWDNIDGNNVNFYIDLFGRKWMATSAWSIFRVKAQ